MLGIVCATRGHDAEAAAWLERALVHANASGDRHTRLSITQTLFLYLRERFLGAEEPRTKQARDALLKAQKLSIR